MRFIIFPLITLLLWPIVGYSRHHGGYYGYAPAPRSYYRPPVHYRPSHYHPYRPHRSHRSHRDNWIVPLAIAGGVIGIVALSQLTWPSAPPLMQPQVRLCRDTYNHYDEFGNYLYTRYVDRPCF